MPGRRDSFVAGVRRELAEVTRAGRASIDIAWGPAACDDWVAELDRRVLEVHASMRGALDEGLVILACLDPRSSALPRGRP